MTELARVIVSRLRQLIGDRRRAKRRHVRLPAIISLANRRISRNGSRHVATLNGHTLDLSTTGMALIVPAIRIGGQYLVGEERRLQLKLELPAGPIEMEVVAVRYESIEEHPTETGYLIGVRISDMSEKDRTRYNEYVRKSLKREPVV